MTELSRDQAIREVRQRRKTRELQLTVDRKSWEARMVALGAFGALVWALGMAALLLIQDAGLVFHGWLWGALFGVGLAVGLAWFVSGMFLTYEALKGRLAAREKLSKYQQEQLDRLELGLESEEAEAVLPADWRHRAILHWSGRLGASAGLRAKEVIEFVEETLGAKEETG